MSDDGRNAQIFDNPSDRQLILGFAGGVVGFLLVVFAWAWRSSQDLPEFDLVSGGVLLLGIAGLVYGMFTTMFWRMVAAAAAIGLAVSYALAARAGVTQIMEVGVTPSFDYVDLGREALCAVLSVAFATLTSYWDLQDAKKGRGFNLIFNAVTTVVLGMLAWGLVNYIASQRTTEFDWTASKIYTLSEESRAIVRTVKTPLTMHLLMRSDSETYQMVHKLAEQFRSEMGNYLTLRSLDPIAQSFEFEKERKRLEIQGRSLTDQLCVVLETGRFESKQNPETGQMERVWVKEKSKQIGVSELFESERSVSVGKPGKAVFKGEQLITNGILEVTSGVKPNIYFLEGHGEHGIVERERNGDGAFGLASMLRQRFFEVQALNMAGGAKGIPEDCDLLVILGAEDGLSDAEMVALTNYLAKGGKLFCMLDAFVTRDYRLKASRLDGLLKLYNIEPLPHLVLQKQLRLAQGRDGGMFQIEVYHPDDVILDAFDASHPVVRPLSGRRLEVKRARPMRVISAAEGAKATALINASEGTIAVKDLRGFDKRGEPDPKKDLLSGFVLAAASEKTVGDKATRIVAIGDSDFVNNAGVRQARNLEFFLNSVNWLLQREGQFVQEAKKPPTYALQISNNKKVVLKLGAFILPILPLSLGFLMFLIRRR